MPVIQELINFDETFSKLKEEPIIVNDIVCTTKEERERIENLIKVKFGNDMLSTIPSCQCGHLLGEYAIGEKCPKCHDYVKSIGTENLEPILWVRKPEGILKLMSPIIWTMLDKRFSKDKDGRGKVKFSILKWIMDTSYKPQIRKPKVIEEAQALGISRGYNNFIEHFEEYVNILFSMKTMKRSKKQGLLEDQALKELISNNLDKVFCNFLPLPNKALLIIGQNNLGTRVHDIIIDAIDAISMMISIDTEGKSLSIRQKENKTAKSLIKLAEFYLSAEKSIVSAKTGVFRKHVFGGRSYFSGRAVISSITSPHNYEELEIPWSIGVTILRPMIINKLLRQGFKLNDAIGYIHANVYKYDKRLDDIMQQLIDESRDKRIYCLLHRNPTLLQGSSQRLYFTKIKKDPHDPTIGFSILDVSAPNADTENDFTI